MDNKKIIIAHPGKQHSFHTAIALEKSGMLYKYITTVYNRRGSLTNVVARFVNDKNKNKARTRFCKQLLDEKIVQINEFSGLILLFLMRLKNKKFYKLWRSYIYKNFEKRVAKYAIKNKVDAVISYDFCSATLFDIIAKKAPNIVRILDVSIANRSFMKDNFLKDCRMTKDEEIIREQSDLWNQRIMDSSKKEIEKSNFFFVPSKVVNDSLLYVGVNPNKIKIIPYGVDISKFNYHSKSIVKKPLKLLFVGSINYRKGIHHLLKVVSEFNPSEVTVNLAGEVNKSGVLYSKYSSFSNINFLGFVTRDKLEKIYQEADVFVFPTLGEGFGLVVLEAMSCGLPVIISNLAGGNDAITEGEDGFIFEAGNDMELKEKIQWFIDNPSKIPQMSLNARKKAEGYTWEKYYDSIANQVKAIMMNEES